MKWALRIVAALVVLLGALFALILFALPRLADSEAVRTRIEAAARHALGRELRYRDIDFALLPPSLLVLEPEVSGETPEAPALATAERVSLRVALLPLLARRVLVDSLVVDGARVHLVRSAEGLQLPSPSPSPRGGEEAGSVPAAGEAGGEDAQAAGKAAAGIAIGVRRVALHGAAVVLEDRAVTPSVTWRVEDLELELSGTSPEAPLEIESSARLASGGELTLSGTATLAGALDLGLSLRDVALAAVGPYLQAASPGTRLAGRLGGEVSVAGPAAAPESVRARLALADAALETAAARISGPLDLEAEIASPLAGPRGPFRIDASAARIEAGSAFAKPAGTPAELSGRLAVDAGGAALVEDLSLTLRNLVLRGRLRTAPRLAAELRADETALAGWEQLLPALGDGLGGAVAIPALAVSADPLALDGSVELRDVVVDLPDRAPLTLRGTVDAQGTELRSRNLVIVAAEQSFDVQAVVRDVASAPRFEVGLAADGVATDALLAAYTGKGDRLYGPLDVAGNLRGSVGERPLLDTLVGRLDFGIEGGRIVGVSLLEAVFAKLGSLGGLAVEAGRAFGGRDLQRFYGDEFESMRGRLRVAEGTVHADELQLLYRGYGADLTGTLGLVGLSLDLRGTLTIFEELDAELARRMGLGKSYTPRSRTLPLASVGGTLGAPRVQLESKPALQFAAGYARDAYKERLGREVEEELGPGTGEAVQRGLDVLEGILGGGKKR